MPQYVDATILADAMSEVSLEAIKTYLLNHDAVIFDRVGDELRARGVIND